MNKCDEILGELTGSARMVKTWMMAEPSGYCNGKVYARSYQE